MTPRVIRLLGATIRPSPSAEPGMTVGKANPAAAAWTVLRRKVRRDGDGSAPWGRFIGVARVDGRVKGGRDRGSGWVLPDCRGSPEAADHLIQDHRSGRETPIRTYPR